MWYHVRFYDLLVVGLFLSKSSHYSYKTCSEWIQMQKKSGQMELFWWFQIF